MNFSYTTSYLNSDVFFVHVDSSLWSMVVHFTQRENKNHTWYYIKGLYRHDDSIYRNINTPKESHTGFVRRTSDVLDLSIFISSLRTTKTSRRQ